ncbi:MAG: CocE/NonD family hydrolase, partial [Bryobacteraceae bacterium]
TPYGKQFAMDNPNGSNQYFARHGYVSIMQDCRGRFTSEGNYEPIFQETADGYDAVEWAARLPWSNGRVGTCGQSYMGLTQYAIACSDPMPPSLQAMAPVSASSDFHESWVYHTGGASMWGWLIPYAIFKGRNTLQRTGRSDLLARMDDYVEPGTNFSMPLRDEWFRHRPISDWIDLLKETAPYLADHINRAEDREYWERANVPAHARSVTVPMLHISSWYDIFAEGAVNAFMAIREKSHHPAARQGQRLIMGPWAHLLPYSVPNSKGTGEIDFGAEALVDFHEMQLRWFDYHLKDIDSGIMAEAPVTVFLMGENRWKHLDDWPPPAARYVRYFLHSAGSANGVDGNGTLSTVPPADQPDDTYTFDPRDPVPTLGGHNLSIPLGVQDQRPVEGRQDVLVFTSDPVERPLEVLGPVEVHLWATTSAPDTDFTAKLVDVHPDGYAQNLLDGIIRGRYRKSVWEPEVVEPGRPNEYRIDLWNTGNVFLPGHRIRLEISSSNFPRFDVNPNTGAPFGENAQTETAHQVVHHRPGMESFIVLPVIPR